MIELKPCYKEQLEDQAKHKECLTEECINCPLNIFNNKDKSCHEIAKEFLELLNNQKKVQDD